MGIGAQFSRLKVWNALENFLYSDVNAEFNNILNNLYPAKIGGNSATVAQMQQTTNPGTVGAENLQTNLAGEVQTLRYMVQQITGGAQWYSPPAATIVNLSSTLNVPQNRIISGGNVGGQPMFLIPNGSNATFSMSSFLVVSIAGTTYTYTSSVSGGPLSLAPTTNNTCLATDPTLLGNEASKYYGEKASAIKISSIGSAITALDRTYQAFKDQTTGEIFLAYVDITNNCLRNAYRGFFFNSTNTWSSRQALLNGDALQLLKITHVFATQNGSPAVPGLDITYNPPVYGVRQPSSPSIGDYFFNLNTQQWFKFTGSAYGIQQAIYVGVVVQDTSNCVAARSADFFGAYSERNNVKLEYLSGTVVQASEAQTKINSYGTEYFWQRDRLTFNSALDMDTGVTLSPSTPYFFYVTSTGDRAISNLRPYDRTFDLLGWYHPSKPYRCIGEAQTDASSNFIQNSVAYLQYVSSDIHLDSPLDIKNYSISTTSGSSALTVNLLASGFMPPSPTSPISAMFLNPNATSGTSVLRKFGFPISLSIPSTATLGTVPGVSDNIHVYLADNSGVGIIASGYLAVAGSRVFDEYSYQSTQLLSGASTSRYTLYSSTTLSNIPVRYIGQINVASTAGANTWVNSPSQVSMGFKKPQIMSSLHLAGLSSIQYAGTSSFNGIPNLGNIIEYVGNDFSYTPTPSSGTTVTLNNPGLYFISFQYISNSSNAFTITRNLDLLNASTASVIPVISSTALAQANSINGAPQMCSVVARFNPGDIIRPLHQRQADSSTATISFKVIKVGE